MTDLSGISGQLPNIVEPVGISDQLPELSPAERVGWQIIDSLDADTHRRLLALLDNTTP